MERRWAAKKERENRKWMGRKKVEKKDIGLRR